MLNTVRFYFIAIKKNHPCGGFFNVHKEVGFEPGSFTGV